MDWIASAFAKASPFVLWATADRRGDALFYGRRDACR